MNEIAPFGGVGIDPAVAYDTVDAEPIENVYESLVSYQGSSGTVYVPVAATCVPGTTQCKTDYGGATAVAPGAYYENIAYGGAAGPLYGNPTNWTYVIDPNAHFSDGAKVWPSDVMFSISRDLLFSNPFVYTAGWIAAQALLSTGNPSWDLATGALSGLGPIHYPFNSTPANILGSMLINSTAYCPAKAMNGRTGDGCITFLATANGVPWPFFNDYMADQLGASIVSCDWTSVNAGSALPGWNYPSSGTGSCLLPDGSNNTNSGWSTYLATLSPYAWDSVWAAEYTDYPYDYAFSGGTTAMGSGPYQLYGTYSLPTGYTLNVNPYYMQPGGCGAIAALAVYATACWPKANGNTIDNGYVYNVTVTYVAGDSSSDAATYEAYQSHDLDIGGFTPLDAADFKTGKSDNILNYMTFPGLSDFFLLYNLNYSNSLEWQSGWGPAPTSPATLMTDIAVRNFMTESFPYGWAFATQYQTSGITFQYAAGGPIPYGMGGTSTSPAGYYPTNVSYAGSPNPVTDTATNPCPASSYASCSKIQGTWAWWWAQANTPGSQYYDPTLVAGCNHPSPCTMVLFGEAGATSLNAALQQWATDIDADSDYNISATVTVIGFSDLIDYGIGGGLDSGPLQVWNLGWAPDYEVPLDYLSAEVAPNADFTFTDSTQEQLDASESLTNATLCGYTADSFQDLVHWAKTVFNDSCQGYAYDIATWADGFVAPLNPNNPTQLAEQKLYYNLATHIFNTLSLYSWQGQANEVPAVAPWINIATLNENPMIGGGGDNLWFMVKYNVFTTVHFYENGLTRDSEWSSGVSGGLPAGVNPCTSQVCTVYPPTTYPSFGTQQNVSASRSPPTVGISPSVIVQSPYGEPTASKNYSGYGFEWQSLSPPVTVTATSPTADTLLFAWNGAANITGYGLPSGTGFTVTYTSNSTHGPAAVSQYTGTTSYASAYYNNTSLAPSFGTTYYKIGIVPPQGYGVCSSGTFSFTTPAGTVKCSTLGFSTGSWTTVTSATGTIHLAVSNDTAYAVKVWFYPIYEVATFTESGLPANDQWTVTVTNYTTVAMPGYGFTMVGGVWTNSITVTAPTTSIKFYMLQSPTANPSVFGYTVNMYAGVSNYVPSISAGYFKSSAASSVTITAIDPSRHAVTLYGPAEARMTVSLPIRTLVNNR